MRSEILFLAACVVGFILAAAIGMHFTSAKSGEPDCVQMVDHLTENMFVACECDAWDPSKPSILFCKVKK